MKTLITFLLLSFSGLCEAADGWFCEMESSYREGRTIYACGKGTAKREETARELAFGSAKHEFFQICNASQDCEALKADVSPKRTSCEFKAHPDKRGGRWTCYRMIQFDF